MLTLIGIAACLLGAWLFLRPWWRDREAKKALFFYAKYPLDEKSPSRLQLVGGLRGRQARLAQEVRWMVERGKHHISNSRILELGESEASLDRLLTVCAADRGDFVRDREHIVVCVAATLAHELSLYPDCPEDLAEALESWGKEVAVWARACRYGLTKF